MHKELIGQKASLRLPCTIDATPVLLGFVEELMEVSGDEAVEPDRLEQELRRAVDEICRHDGVDESCSVVAKFAIHAGGVDVHLTCENQDAADVGVAERVIAAREA